MSYNHEEIREKYKELFEHSLDPVYIFDLKGNFLDANDKFLEKIEYKRNELPTLNFRDLLVGDELRRADKNVKEIIRTGQQSKFSEYKLNSKSGNFIYVETFGIPIRRNEEISCILGIAKDITDLKNAQESLKRSEKKYRDLFDTTPFSIVLLNSDGIIVDCNPTLERMFGYKKAEIIGRNYENISIIHQDFLSYLQQLFSKLLKGEEVHRTDLQMYKKDGTLIWTTIQASIVKIVGKIFVQVVIHDITKRKNLTQQLLESENLYKTFVRTSPNAIIVTDLKGKIIDVSQKAIELYGGDTMEDLIGMNAFEFIIPEEQSKAMENLQKTLKGESVKAEYKVARKGGTFYICELNANLIKDADGKPKAFIGIMRDITEQKLADKKLKESEEQFRHLYEKSPISLWTVRISDGQFIRANDNAAKLMGYDTLDEFYNNCVTMDIVPAEYRREFIRKLNQEGEITGIEASIIDNKGNEKIITMSAKLYREEGYVEGVSTDITELKNVQKALKESERKYRDLFESSANMILLINLRGTVIDVNKSFVQIFGIEKQRLIDKKVFRMEDLLPKNRELFMEKFNELIEKGFIEPFEVQVFDKERTLKWMILQASIIEIEGDQLVQVILQDINERKQAEKLLKESEEKYRYLFEDSPNMLFLLDLNGNILEVNMRFLETFTYKEEELIGKNFQQIGRFDDVNISVLSGKYEKLIKNGHIKPFEVPFTNEKGEIRWFNLQASLVEIGNKQMILVILQDIHERKQIEQNLKESEEQYRTTINSFSDPLHVVDRSLKIILANPAFKRWLMGLDLDGNIEGKTIFEAFPFLPEKVAIEYQQVFNSGIQHFSEESNFIGNREIITESRKIPIFKGENVAQVVTILRDITNRKRIENKLRSSETKYRHLFESAPFLIGLADLDGKILALNSATKQFIKAHIKEDLIGKNFRDVFSIYKQEKAIIPKAEGQIEKLLKGEVTDNFEFPLVRSDGSIQWVNLNLSLINIEDQTLIQLIMQDITKRKKGELLVKEEFKKLKELEQIRKDLISRVSHELKTPLIPVISGSELLKSVYSDQIGQDAREIIEMIDKGGKRLKEMVAQLIKVSRIEYNKLELEKRKNNLSEIILESSNDMKYLLETRKLTLGLEIPEEFWLNIDKNRIGEVITNLISNAMKFTPPFGKITIKLLEQDGWAVLSVTDTGVGLTEKEMEVLFTRFGKIDRYNEGLEYIDIKGSGLGLYICKEILKLHGGEIWAESEGRNKGSTFFVKIPIK